MRILAHVSSCLFQYDTRPMSSTPINSCETLDGVLNDVILFSFGSLFAFHSFFFYFSSSSFLLVHQHRKFAESFNQHANRIISRVEGRRWGLNVPFCHDRCDLFSIITFPPLCFVASARVGLKWIEGYLACANGAVEEKQSSLVALGSNKILCDYSFVRLLLLSSLEGLL